MTATSENAYVATPLKVVYCFTECVWSILPRCFYRIFLSCYAKRKSHPKF